MTPTINRIQNGNSGSGSRATMVQVTSGAPPRRRPEMRYTFTQNLDKTLDRDRNNEYNEDDSKGQHSERGGSSDMTNRTQGRQMKSGEPPDNLEFSYGADSHASDHLTEPPSAKSSSGTQSTGSDDLDMTLTKTTNSGLKFQVRLCVKEEIFRVVKFIDIPTMLPFDMAPNSLCGIVIKYCCKEEVTAKQGAKFWMAARPMVTKSHTHVRNNYIKGMQSVYLGKLYSCHDVHENDLYIFCSLMQT